MPKASLFSRRVDSNALPVKVPGQTETEGGLGLHDIYEHDTPRGSHQTLTQNCHQWGVLLLQQLQHPPALAGEIVVAQRTLDQRPRRAGGILVRGQEERSPNGTTCCPNATWHRARPYS